MSTTNLGQFALPAHLFCAALLCSVVRVSLLPCRPYTEPWPASQQLFYRKTELFVIDMALTIC
jgi:hypothetical protein